jgi:Putative transposase
LISADASAVAFKYKDYRIEGPDRYKTMTLEPGEFIRRFLVHVLPKGFHRIRHYGLLANGCHTRAEKLARARQLIAAAGQLDPPPQPTQKETSDDTTLSASKQLDHACPHCGNRMVIIETFEAGPRHSPSSHRAHSYRQDQQLMTRRAIPSITLSSFALASAGHDGAPPFRRSRRQSPTQSARHLLILRPPSPSRRCLPPTIATDPSRAKPALPRRCNPRFP